MKLLFNAVLIFLIISVFFACEKGEMLSEINMIAPDTTDTTEIITIIAFVKEELIYAIVDTIMIISIEGEEIDMFIPELGSIGKLKFSLDGNKLFFSTFRNPSQNLFVLDLESRESKFIVDSVKSFDISSDGKFLVYSTKSSIYLHELDNSVQQIIFDRPTSHLCFSPNNNKFCFNNGHDLYVHDIKESSTKSILHFNPTSDNKYYDPINPQYSSDGSRIVFQKFYDGYPYNFSESFISIINSDGSNLNITTSHGDKPNFLPDDSNIIFSSGNKIIGLYSGTIISNGWIYRYKCSPDGSHLVYSAVGLNNHGDLYKFNLATHDVTNLTNSGTHESIFDIIQIEK